MNDKNPGGGNVQQDANNDIPLVIGIQNTLHIFTLVYTKSRKPQKSANLAVSQLGEGFSQLKIHSDQEVTSVEGCVTSGNCDPKVKAVN